MNLVDVQMGPRMGFFSHDELAGEIKKIPEFECMKIFTTKEGVYALQPRFMAVVEKDRDEAVAVVSDRYALVQTRDVFNLVLSHLEEDIQGEIFYYRGRGLLHVFLKDSDIGICVMNSVDRSSAINVFFIKKVEGTTVYLPPVHIEKVSGYKRLHVGVPLSEVTNFSEILLDAPQAWGIIVEQLSKTTLTNDIVQEVKEALGTKALVELVDQFGNGNLDRFTGNRPSLWDLLLAVLKAASASKFKTPVHREKRLRELSTLLVAMALKMS